MFEIAHGGSREHFPQEERAEPTGSLPDHLWQADLHVGLIEGLHTAKLLDVFRLFLDQRVDHVVHRDDAEDVTGFVYDGYREQVVLGDEARHLLAIGERTSGHRLPGISDISHGCRVGRRHHFSQ
jgi:hypothetical protein